MDGFSNLDETQSQTSVVYKAANFKTWVTVTWKNRTTLEKGLVVALVIMVVLALGLIIGLASSSAKGDNQEQDSSSPEVCISDDCTMAASRVLESMDRTVNPCEDFYTYACGAWKKTHVIPEDRISLQTLDALADRIQVTNKELLEDPNNHGVNEIAWRKAKDLYASCMNTDRIEQKGVSVVIPLLNELGGWPVLGTSPGGNWNGVEYNLTKLLVTLAKYSDDTLIHLEVNVDSKKTTRRVIYVDQPGDGLYGSATLQDDANAEEVLARSVVIGFGADPATAATDMEEVLKLQAELAKITMDVTNGTDPDVLYNRMTILEMNGNFTDHEDPLHFNWYNYIAGVMAQYDIAVTIRETEPVVVQAVPYFKHLINVLQQFPSRTIANYIVWSFMKHLINLNALPSHLKELMGDYTQKRIGQETARSRWRECEEYVTKHMKMVIVQKYLMNGYDKSTTESAEKMVGNIRASFNERMNEVDWMDEHTKSLAREKAEAIRNWIGYPDDVFNNDHLNKIYENVTMDKDEYFHNVIQNLKQSAVARLGNLRKTFDKTSEENVWIFPPTTVNAFYHRVFNFIVILVGILQAPLFDKNQPKSMNYGGIGTVLGHELTHGFDSIGRKYNKDGELKQWWEQKIIDKFNEEAQCMVDQYSGFLVPEANMTLNGKFTMGENIADNGGVKQSYRAYRSWIKRQGKEERRLPGLNLTHDQLFFISFAQSWCINANRQASILSVLGDNHSPGQFRVIGSLQNSAEFAQTFNCPRNSYMNPDKKCSVW